MATGHKDNVLVQADLMRVVVEVHHATDGRGLLDLLALGAEQKRQSPPLPEGDEQQPVGAPSPSVSGSTAGA
jgi:hypothetical protein